MSVIPSWTDTGIVFTEEQLKGFLKEFKYQRSLWPDDAEVVEYVVTDERTSAKHTEIFSDFDKDLTFEKLKGSAY